VRRDWAIASGFAEKVLAAGITTPVAEPQVCSVEWWAALAFGVDVVDGACVGVVGWECLVDVSACGADAFLDGAVGFCGVDGGL
jgi:hypothetical protein